MKLRQPPPKWRFISCSIRRRWPPTFIIADAAAFLRLAVKRARGDALGVPKSIMRNNDYNIARY